MQGYRVHMLPGFDCYGLAIEDRALIHNPLSRLPSTLHQSEAVKTDDEATLAKRAICRQYVKDSILM